MVIQELLGPNGMIFSTEDANGNVDIYWGGRLYYSFNRSDLFEKKLGIALLANLGVLRKTICSLFQISRRTITNIVDVYKNKGVAGLKDYKPGPESVEEELIQFVIKKYIELEGKRGFQNKILEAVEEKAVRGEFKNSISRSMLQKILKEYKADREEQKQRNLEERLNREREEANRERRNKGKNERDDADNGDKQPELIQAIPEGEEICVEHGGSAAAAIFLDTYGTAHDIPNTFEKGNHYSNRELAVTFAMLNAGEVVTVEQGFENLASYEMGGLLGKNKLPSLSLYRKRIPEIVEQMDMREVLLETAKRVKKKLAFSRIVYIDGHFMPYHGSSETLHGYYPQKRLAMHGREYFFVHDRNGLPVYAAISDGYHKMQHYIATVDEKLRDIYGVKEKELLEIFDRGGYSKAFCVGIAERIRFICWRSDGRVVPTIEEWEEVVVEHQGNDYGEVKERTFYAWGRTREFQVEDKTAIFREVWIRKGNKVSPALTNDMELSTHEVVRALTRRWGAQENMFKELKDHGIDRIHSYGKEEYTEEFLYKQGLEDRDEGIIREIANPEIRVENKKLAKLTAEKRKLAEKILSFEKAEKKKELAGVKIKYDDVAGRIKKLIERRSSLPKKVNLFGRIQEENIVRLCDEKKLFFDWLKMNAIWAKREMIEIVKPYYQDLRDLNKFVKSILNSRTYVRRKDDTLYVEFPFQHSKKRQEALVVLCDFINGHKKIDLGLDYHRLIFSVREKH